MQIDHVFIRVSPGGAEAELLRATFGTWDYAPAYLPPGMTIGIAKAPPSEPMWFCTSAGKAPEHFAADRRQPLDHAAGLGNITGLRCTMPSLAALSPAATASGVELAEGDAHLLEISFDHAARGLSKDFRPALPLIFHY